MRISQLVLKSFRSYDSLTIGLTQGSHLFLGPNGGGKTNLIEAISFLSQARSCLRADPENIVRFGSTFSTIRADIVSDSGEEKSCEFIFQTSPKRSSAFYVNDVRVSLLEFIGLLPTVLFLPQSLTLFTGTPGERRAFLDTLITQLRPRFATERMEYERILKQRNALLKGIAQHQAHEDDLTLWDEQLSDIGSKIVVERRAVLEAMNADFLSCIHSLSEKYQTLTLDYLSTYEVVEQGDFQAALLRARSRDIALATTTIGPHRDDWRCFADTHDLAYFASRGQQRTALLALLFVAAGLFERARSERPVILLDDVLSELDAAHQKALLSHFKDHQVLMTGTHATDDFGSCTRWTVGGGVVQQS